MRLQVPVIVRIGQRRLPLDDVLAFGPGAIIELNRDADDELDLMINNKPIAKGEAVKVGENFGLRVKSVGSRSDRVQALGGGG